MERLTVSAQKGSLVSGNMAERQDIEETGVSEGNERIDRVTLEAWRVQSDFLHRQIRHIQIIRGWAITLTAGLIAVIVTQREPLAALGSLLLISFWYADHVYGKYLQAYVEREKAFRLSLASQTSDDMVREAMRTEVTYSPNWARTLSYSAMFTTLLVGAVTVVFW